MKYTEIVIFISLLSLAACFNKSGKNEVGKDADIVHINDNIYSFKVFQFDTTRTIYEKAANSTAQWSKLDDFFPVYQFSDACLGIGIEVGDGGHYELIDKFVNTHRLESDKIVDTLGPFILKQSAALEKAIFGNDTTRFFNIYCTKGRTISRINAVLYNYEECSELLVLALTPIDKAKYGEPLVASKQVFDLAYSPLNGFKEDLSVYEKYLDKYADYRDSLNFIQFAYDSTHIFAFSDDFIWHKKNDKRCWFPSRQVFKKDGAAVKLIWGGALDLFGIGCD
jgi:hypothetical protein